MCVDKNTACLLVNDKRENKFSLNNLNATFFFKCHVPLVSLRGLLLSEETWRRSEWIPERGDVERSLGEGEGGGKTAVRINSNRKTNKQISVYLEYWLRITFKNEL